MRLLLSNAMVLAAASRVGTVRSWQDTGKNNQCHPEPLGTSFFSLIRGSRLSKSAGRSVVLGVSLDLLEHPHPRLLCLCSRLSFGVRLLLFVKALLELRYLFGERLRLGLTAKRAKYADVTSQRLEHLRVLRAIGLTREIY